MWKQVALAASGVLALVAMSEATTPKTDDEKLLYVAGAMLAQNVRAWNLMPKELSFVLQGFGDSASGREPSFDASQLRPELHAFVRKRAAAAAEAEERAGEPFMQAAAGEAGARQTDSGLVIRTLRPGFGASPRPDDRVKVSYHGTLRDGTVFDSSVDRREPAMLSLRGVMPCWGEGLQLMHVGERARLVCPPQLAYGVRGAPPKISPGATLNFEIELLEIEASVNAVETVE